LQMWDRACGFSTTKLQSIMGNMSSSGQTQHVHWSRERMAWPPRPLDVAPRDCFLWGHLKGYFYAIPPRTIEDLVQRIEAAVTTVDVDMLWREELSLLGYKAV
jgi:hypothetical protein